ncbi:hypothetical protein [Aurantiacibacter luteus]|uniref:Uncharacterized protein n=1 Tax=Aurantiacibacter luteus TaxID=1581420 RepID=A0A0G9MVJ5_9SPHN|nr:hypothetical protein [Aurantiacibacter luteus]KLE34787.1 hypothetical protein AAW00_11655 [Aurantiacibacter luteus]
MNRFLLPVAAALCAATALPAFAQSQQPQQQPQEDDPIVVDGERIRSAEARNQARDITPRSPGWGDPLARFQNPVCAGVWGLTEENAQAVIDRIYDNAERAGVAIDQTPGCSANLWVMFVNDPLETFRDLRRENSVMVRNLSTFDRDRVEEQTGPALAWNLISTRNREGQFISAGNVDPGEIPGNQVTAMSRATSAVRMDIDASVVLIRRSAIAGLDAYSLADYATMRALARTEEPEEAGRFDSVLTLFGDGEVDRLSEFDLAYLQDLYSSRATQPGRQGHGRIGVLMDRADGS